MNIHSDSDWQWKWPSRNSEFCHLRWWCSKVMWVYQRVVLEESTVIFAWDVYASCWKGGDCLSSQSHDSLPGVHLASFYVCQFGGATISPTWPSKHSPRYGSSNAIRGAAMAKKAAAVLAAKGSANLFKFVLKKSDTTWLQMLGIQNMLEPGSFVGRPSFCAVVCDFEHFPFSWPDETWVDNSVLQSFRVISWIRVLYIYI